MFYRKQTDRLRQTHREMGAEHGSRILKALKQEKKKKKEKKKETTMGKKGTREAHGSYNWGECIA